MDVSHALILYIGHGRSPVPDFQAERLQEHYGSEVTVELLPRLIELADDFYDYKRSSRNQFRDAKRAARRFTRRHPDISEEAVDALAWAYAIDMR